MRLLELRSVDARYGAAGALHGVTLSVDVGELVAIVGPSGSGKSTMIRAVAGTVRTSGDVIVDGERILYRTPEGLARRGVFVIPESRGTLGRLSVRENLELGAWLRRGASARDLVHVYEAFPRLFELRAVRADHLTALEQQQLALGRAMMARPRLLIVDEPSRGLSAREAAGIFAALQEQHEGGLTIVLAESRAAPVLASATRTYTLEAGRIASTLER